MDFERAAMNPTVATYRSDRIFGCFFHLVRNLLKHMSDAGLFTRYRRESGFALSASMIASLGFVPTTDLDAATEVLETELPRELLPTLYWFEQNYVGPGTASIVAGGLDSIQAYGSPTKGHWQTSTGLTASLRPRIAEFGRNSGWTIQRFGDLLTASVKSRTFVTRQAQVHLRCFHSSIRRIQAVFRGPLGAKPNKIGKTRSHKHRVERVHPEFRPNPAMRGLSEVVSPVDAHQRPTVGRLRRRPRRGHPPTRAQTALVGRLRRRPRRGHPPTRIRFSSRDDYENERNRILTIKYGKEQMALIRKRLHVEMWLLDQLESLCDKEKCKEDAIDIEQLLDMASDAERRSFLEEELKPRCSDPRKIESFTEELLEKLKTL
uniref:Uncharacterized protein n=1 Tax=Trichuris muris TaxID=70415 RepID=A0A5S6R117_TRIMR